MTLVVMAAGMGNRFGGLKQITPFGPSGEVLLDYSVYDAKKAGFDKVVFIIKEENLDLFKEVVGKHLEKYIEVQYAFQKQDDLPVLVDMPKDRVKPWGTLQALYCVRDFIDTDFVILNADDFYGLDPFLQVANYFKSTNDKIKACILGYKLNNTLTEEGTVSRGVCDVKDGFLVKIDERLKIKREDGIIKYFEDDNSYPIDENAVASMNFFGFSKDIFDFVEDELKLFFEENKNNLNKAEALLPNFVGDLINKSMLNVRVFDTDSKWMGVTYKEDADKVKKGINELVENNEYPNKLWE